MLLVLLTSSPSYSQEPVLPAWANIDGNACYDLAGAKKLKLFEVDCRESAALVLNKAKQVTALQQAVDALKAKSTSLEDMLKRTEDLAAEQDEHISKQAAMIEDLEKWSVKGGALPWVVSAVAVSFVGGGVAVLWALK
jgi:septal ring factor EnvC (AmiA/AmiB activator)